MPIKKKTKPAKGTGRKIPVPPRCVTKWREQVDAAIPADPRPTARKARAPKPPASEMAAGTLHEPGTEPMRETKPTLRGLAEAVVAAWKENTDQDKLAEDVWMEIDALRWFLAALPKPRGTGEPKAGTKAEMVLTMVKTGNGASLQEIMTATGWQIHTARAFLSVARKNGAPILITPKDRATGVGPIYRSAS